MSLPTRNEVPTSLKWDLTQIFKNKQDWQRSYQEVSEQIKQIRQLKQNFTASGKALYQKLNKILQIKRKLERVLTYATLASDVDTSNEIHLSQVQGSQQLASKFTTATAFIRPAMLHLSQNKFKQLEREEPALKKYQQWLAEITRLRPHTLPVTSERLISGVTDALNASRRTYASLKNDLHYGYVQDEEGQMRQLTEGLYNFLIQSPKRQVRQNAFLVLYAGYDQFQNTFAATLAGTLKAHNYLARVHHYPSAKAASLATENIPLAVYDNLIRTVHHHLPLLHRYVNVRKRVLRLPNLQMWDMYLSLTGRPPFKINFLEAKQLVLKALAPLGKEYLHFTQRIFDQHLIDAAQNQHKVSGAYTSGCYDSPPYELLNWTDDLDGLYMLVHETGHALHSWLTWHNQPYLYGHYASFVAEIASTTNENLLTNYLLKKSKDPHERAFILNYYLDSFKGNLFRQTQLAEFEEKIHQIDAKGKALTADRLDRLYGQLNQKYYGSNVISGREITKEWARIPHFYYNFYVYKYATGFAAGTILANRLAKGDQPLRQHYLAFLKAGSSKSPMQLVKELGIDMNQPEYLKEVFHLFAKRLAQFSYLLQQLRQEKGKN